MDFFATPAVTDVIDRVRLFDDRYTLALLAGVFTLLAVGAFVGWLLRRQPATSISPALIRLFNQRIVAWWAMFATLIFSVVLGRPLVVILFFFVSFWALREFITMTPTRLADHRTLFWTFFVITPLQYFFVFVGNTYAWWFSLGPEGDLYGLYSIFIPVYCSLLIPARMALAGDPKRFLERFAKVQSGLMICVYALSHAPALLDLHLVTWNSESGTYVKYEGSPSGLLFYFIILVQVSDVCHYLANKIFTRHVIAPAINGSRTWEGLLVGTLATALAGLSLWWVTPFTLAGSACMALIISLMGFCGTMVMSAVKRDRGVRDYGTLVRGHVGVLDRIDSICFAAPVFYHLTRFFLSPSAGMLQRSTPPAAPPVPPAAEESAISSVMTLIQSFC